MGINVKWCIDVWNSNDTNGKQHAGVAHGDSCNGRDRRIETIETHG